MGRRISEKTITSKTGRAELKARGKPYYRGVSAGLHLGYRKGRDAKRWVARIYLGKGQYHVEAVGHVDDGKAIADGHTTLDYAQALEKARELHTKLVTGSNGVSGKYTVAEAIAAYLASLEGRASQSYISGRLKAYVKPELAAKEAAKLISEEIEAWHRAMSKSRPRTRGKKRDIDLKDDEVARKRKVSANMVLAYLKAALNYAVKKKKVSGANCEWRLVKPFENVNTARIRYLSIAEAQRLINGADPAFRPMIQAALLTGARYAELCRLLVEDYHPDSKTIQVRVSKTGKPRHIILTDEGAAFFAGICAGRPAREPMLGKWKQSQQTKPMKVACERAGLDPIGIHGLRHTWASLSVMAGMELMVVARGLGHSSTRMVEKHYCHLAPSYIADAIRKHAPRFGIAASNVKAIS